MWHSDTLFAFLSLSGAYNKVLSLNNFYLKLSCFCSAIYVKHVITFVKSFLLSSVHFILFVSSRFVSFRFDSFLFCFGLNGVVPCWWLNEMYKYRIPDELRTWKRTSHFYTRRDPQNSFHFAGKFTMGNLATSFPLGVIISSTLCRIMRFRLNKYEMKREKKNCNVILDRH